MKSSPLQRYRRRVIFAAGALILMVLMGLPLSKISGINENLLGLAFAIAGIIGASIAIIFSVSVFILQSAANLFSTQYVTQYAEDSKEKKIFWWLSGLAIGVLIIPFLVPNNYSKYAVGILLASLLGAFFLIYELYTTLRSRINPKVVLQEIRDGAIGELKKIKVNYTRMPEDIPENNKKIGMLNPALDQVNCLHEIGLRLLSRNEIKSFDLAVDSIQDIYLKHVELGNHHFTQKPERKTKENNHMLFAVEVFHCLQSMGERVIEDNRKENIYHLFGVYRNIIDLSFEINYVGEDMDNPLLRMAANNYMAFMEKVLLTKNKEWCLGASSYLIELSDAALKRPDNVFSWQVCLAIQEKMDLICDLHLSRKDDSIFLNIVACCFYQIQTAWDKNMPEEHLWGPLFKRLEKCMLSAPADGFPLDSVLNSFQTWQKASVKTITESNNEKELKEEFVPSLQKWGAFLLNFSRRHGLNSQTGWFIIRLARDNLSIIRTIKRQFPKSDYMDDIYKTSVGVFAYFFRGVDKNQLSITNYTSALSFLRNEVNSNLENKYFDVELSINCYIKLVKDQAKYARGSGSGAFGYLRYLESILDNHGFGKTSDEAEIRSKIEALRTQPQ